MATQELASGGWRLKTGIVLERRGGWWDAEEGGASEGTRLRKKERIKERVKDHVGDQDRSPVQSGLTPVLVLQLSLLPVLAARLWTD